MSDLFMFLEPGSLRNLQGKCVRSQYKSIGISKNWINKDPKMYTNGEVTKKRQYIYSTPEGNKIFFVAKLHKYDVKTQEGK